MQDDTSGIYGHLYTALAEARKEFGAEEQARARWGTMPDTMRAECEYYLDQGGNVIAFYRTGGKRN